MVVAGSQLANHCRIGPKEYPSRIHLNHPSRGEAKG